MLLFSRYVFLTYVIVEHVNFKRIAFYVSLEQVGFSLNLMKIVFHISRLASNKPM